MQERPTVNPFHEKTFPEYVNEFLTRRGTRIIAIEFEGVFQNSQLIVMIITESIVLSARDAALHIENLTQMKWLTYKTHRLDAGGQFHEIRLIVPFHSWTA